MTKEEKIALGAKNYLEGEGTFTKIASILKIDKELLIEEVRRQGYIVKKGYKLSTVLGLKSASEEYIANINNNPSLKQIASKNGIDYKSLSRHLKELGVEIINHQNKVKFNENVFDFIDTEEKAYWLGFIYADGYISDNDFEDYDKKPRYGFELSLKLSDIDHINKFNTLLGFTSDKIIQDSFRCRLCIVNKHLWHTLNNYGCTPRKSLTLKFPDIKIFKDESLIKHFIRGYFDGDGCLSYNNVEHTGIYVSVLGTESFLTELQKFLPVGNNFKLGYNNKKQSLITRTLSFSGKTGHTLSTFLYKDATIYLDRKYNKYLEYCRLYEKSYNY